MDGEVGFANVLDRCLAVRVGEQVVLLTDAGTDPAVVAGLVAGIEHRRGVPVVSTMPVPALPGAEPPNDVATQMRGAGAVIELTSLFIGSSAARRAATAIGVRYLAMPGVRLETFRDDGPLAATEALDHLVGLDGGRRCHRRAWSVRRAGLAGRVRHGR